MKNNWKFLVTIGTLGRLVSGLYFPDLIETSPMQISNEFSKKQTAIAHIAKPVKIEKVATRTTINLNNTFETVKAKERTSTVKEIKQKYQPKFLKLQKQANTELKSLLRQAYKEHQSEDNSSLFTLYSKYNALADQLEKKIDKSFYTIYGELQKELKTNHLSPDIAKMFEQRYKKAKEDAKQEMISEVMGSLFR